MIFLGQPGVTYGGEDSTKMLKRNVATVLEP